MRRPFSLRAIGRPRFAVSMKLRYGSPVRNRISSILSHSLRALTVSLTAPSFGSRRSKSVLFITAAMNSSEILTALCRFNALRCTSPVGIRMFRNSTMSGCDTSRYAAYDPLRVRPCRYAIMSASTVCMKGIGPGAMSDTVRTLPQ